MQRLLIEIENEGVEDQPEPERDDARGGKCGDEHERSDDADSDEHGGPSHHTEIGTHQAKGLAVGGSIGEIARRFDYGHRSRGRCFSHHIHASGPWLPLHRSQAAPPSRAPPPSSSPEVWNFALQKAWIQAAMTAELPQGDKQSVK